VLGENTKHGGKSREIETAEGYKTLIIIVSLPLLASSPTTTTERNTRLEKTYLLT